MPKLTHFGGKRFKKCRFQSFKKSCLASFISLSTKNLRQTSQCQSEHTASTQLQSSLELRRFKVKMEEPTSYKKNSAVRFQRNRKNAWNVAVLQLFCHFEIAGKMLLEAGNNDLRRYAIGKHVVVVVVTCE